MKNNICKISLAAFLFLGFIVGGCSSDGDPFKGTDNYVLSLSLEKDGVKYPAAIVNEKITLSIPENINLAGAAVNFKLGELATISPDPLSVTDWNNAIEFVVTSHNNTPRKYQYVVERTAASATGTITLLTQAEVDAFAARGVSVIEGSLVIGAANAPAGIDSIKNLNGLSGLTRISKNLVINNTFGGKDLGGLLNLKSVGNMYLGTTTTSSATFDSIAVSLPNLATAGEIVVNSAIVKTVSFPKLTMAYSLFVNAKSLENIVFPSLDNVTESLSIQAGANAQNTSVKEIVLNKLVAVSGDLNLKYLPALKTLDLSALQSVGGDFSMQYLYGLSELNLPNIQQVGGKLTLASSDALETISCPMLKRMGYFDYAPTYNKESLATCEMPKLEEVDIDFRLSGSKMQNLNLPSLKSVGGFFLISRMNNLTQIHTPALEKCGTFSLNTLPLVTSLDLSKATSIAKLSLISCYKLASVKANTLTDVELNGGSKLCDFTRFDGVETVTGTLTINSYTQNDLILISGVKHIGTFTQQSGKSNGQTIISMPDVETIENLNLTSCTYLKQFIAPKLTAVSGTWNSNFMSYIKSGDIQVPKLKTIGTFNFHGGSYAGAASQMPLTNMNDFASVTKIDNVHLKWWGKMTDYSGLKNIVSSMETGRWKVEGCAYNPTYQDMVDGNYTP